MATHTYRTQSLTVVGDVGSMTETRWPKRSSEWQPLGKRTRGAPSLVWPKYIQNSMEDR